jgi:hypothetical protein
MEHAVAVVGDEEVAVRVVLVIADANALRPSGAV